MLTQGRSNGLKGGGTQNFRLAPSALAWASPENFQGRTRRPAKIFIVVFCAPMSTNGFFAYFRF